MKWLLLIIGIASNASASILIKMAVFNHNSENSTSIFINIVTNFKLIIGIALYFVAFLSYAISLKHFPINVAHPILTCGAVATVAVLSVLILDEPFTFNIAIGILFVTIGIVFLVK